MKVKRIPIFGLVVILLAIGVALVLSRRGTPALDYDTACDLASGTQVEVEGYFYPNARYGGLSAPYLEGDACEGQTCYLSLSSQPRNTGQQVRLQLDTNSSNAFPFVGSHSELNLPFAVVSRPDRVCLHPLTKFRVKGQINKATERGCLIDKVSEITVVDNPPASCGP